MWGFLQDAEGAKRKDFCIAASQHRRIVALSAGPPVSLDSINRGLMLPMSRENWVLKEATFGKIWKDNERYISFIFFYFLFVSFQRFVISSVSGPLHHRQPCEK